MKTLLWGFIGLVGLVVVLALGTLFWGGAFSEIEVGEIDSDAFHMVYLPHQGDYAKIKETIKKVEVYLKKKRTPYTDAIAVYYDNPKQKAKKDLRSDGGYLVEKPIVPEPPLLYRKIPARKVVAGLFTGHPAVGAVRVYPLLHQYVERTGLQITGEAVEIYAVDGLRMLVEYQFPIKPRTPKPSNEPKVKKKAPSKPKTKQKAK